MKSKPKLARPGQIIMALVSINPKSLSTAELISFARPYFKDNMDIKSTVLSLVISSYLTLGDDCTVSSAAPSANKYQKDKEKFISALASRDAKQKELEQANKDIEKVLAKYIKKAVKH